MFFVIPFERDYTLIGTTDLDYSGDLDAVHVSPKEIEYLCDAASSYFRVPVTADQVVWSYSGVRPLYDDGASEAQEATRDYVLKLDPSEGSPPLLSIFGGKITTYRRLAEAALAILSRRLPPARKAAGWTGQAALPPHWRATLGAHRTESSGLWDRVHSGAGGKQAGRAWAA